MKVRFESNGVELAGILDLAVEAGTPFGLFAHCFTCSKNFKAAARLSRYLSTHGVNILRFDFTGLGESEGDFAETSFSSNVSDIVAAANYLARHHSAPQLLIGHSFGGPAVLKAATELPSVRGVVTINSPADPQHVMKWFRDSRTEIERKGFAVVDLGGRPFRLRREFIEDLRRQNQAEVLRRLNRALLVCHAPLDTIVGVENAAETFEAAKHPKSFLSLDQADHFLSEERDTIYLARMIAAWSSGYVESPVEE